MRATEVFTPGAFPFHTYVERANRKYETQLRNGLDTAGQIVSLSGPSKSGKTVLVEKVVGNDNLITLTGAGISKPQEVWEKVLDWMDVPSESSRARTLEGNLSASAGTTAEAGILIAKGSTQGSVAAGTSLAAGNTTTHRRYGMAQVIKEIQDSDFVLLVDDLHYMPRDVQEEVAKQLKEAVRQGVKIVTASVPHRSDDVVRANPELRGRVLTVDLDYWEPKNLRTIAEVGFDHLNIELNQTTAKEFAVEAAGSPQLMQAICLNACFALEARSKFGRVTPVSPKKSKRREIYEQTAAATNFRSLVDVLDSGPKTRGTERKTYRFQDGSEGDVYRCILKTISSDPPALSFSYDDLLKRIRDICIGEEPVGSSVIGSCQQMSKLAEEKFPKERVIDWDEQKLVLDLPDPYLLFYLRWSERLSEPES